MTNYSIVHWLVLLAVVGFWIAVGVVIARKVGKR